MILRAPAVTLTPGPPTVTAFSSVPDAMTFATSACLETMLRRFQGREVRRLAGEPRELVHAHFAVSYSACATRSRSSASAAASGIWPPSKPTLW